MNKNNLILYSALLIFGLVAPFLFPAFKLQISFLWILIILALTWDVQGGQMGYNTFGNILFFGIGMYLKPEFASHIPHMGFNLPLLLTTGLIPAGLLAFVLNATLPQK